MEEGAIIDPAQDARWDTFVENHPLGLMCHLTAWKAIIEQSFPHIKGYFLVRFNSAGGEILTGLPIYLVNSSITGRRLVSIPFATLSDPLVSSKEQAAELLHAAARFSSHVCASHIEVRTLASSQLMEGSAYQQFNLYKHHFLNLGGSLEHLQQRLHRTSVRPIVKRCERIGLELNIDTSREQLQSFFNHYVATRRKLGLPPQPFRFFEKLWLTFAPAGKLRILQATYRGRSIAGLIVFRFKNRVSAEFIGVDQDYTHLNPSHFLFWQAIKLAHQEAFQIFDFGRTAWHNTGLLDFKHRWGTEVRDLPEFWFPGKSASLFRNGEKSLRYRFLKSLVRKIPANFLPLLGEHCYRHMG